MLYRAVLLGSSVFHNAAEPSGGYYDQYFTDVGVPLVDAPQQLSLPFAERTKKFLNQWKTHYQATPEQLHVALQGVLPSLIELRDENLLDVDLERCLTSGLSVRAIIEQSFEAIAKCGEHHETTGASKILHLVHPRLFVMWDNAIGSGYAVGYERTAAHYAGRFIPRIQLVVRRAVEQYQHAQGVDKDAALSIFQGCGHSLAKVVDEYNYAKFTLCSDAVWNEELAGTY